MKNSLIIDKIGNKMRNGLHPDNEGNQIWYLNDQRHRIDGPAFITSDEWLVRGGYLVNFIEKMDLLLLGEMAHMNGGGITNFFHQLPRKKNLKFGKGLKHFIKEI
jgi:hypothetical protein